MSTLMPTYQPLPITIEKGEDVWLWDTQGNKYLDAFAGIAVCNLGHCHPQVVQALQDQAGQLIHTSNMLTIALQQQLADKLVQLAQMDQAFFCNSGAEANETAIKLARLYGHKRGIKNPLIIVMDKAFHGRSLATVSASGSRRVQAGFEPLMPGFVRVPFNDIDALQKIAENTPDVVAVLLEPIQGEGGISVPHPHYLTQVRELCDQQQWLMMLDEVQTGIGRTGRFFAHQHANIVPDVMALAKGLGNGFPVGACLASGPAKDVLQVGNHGSTYGGNPLACRVALTVLEVLQQEKLCDNVTEVGPYLQQHLHEALSDLPGVVAVRGQGLLIGIELTQPCRGILKICAEHGLFVSVTAQKVIRLAPPLTLTKDHADFIVKTLKSAIQMFTNAS